MQDLPTVAVLFRVSYKEGALFPDGVEGHSGVARVERQLFAGLELFCRIGGNRRRIRTCSPAEELVADALRNLVAESEDCHLVRKLKRLRYGLGHVCNIAPIRGVGQGGLGDIVAGRPDRRPLCGVGCVPGDRFLNFGIPAYEGVAGVVRVFLAERGGSNAGIEVAEDHLLEELAANAVGVGDGVGFGGRCYFSTGGVDVQLIVVFQLPSGDTVILIRLHKRRSFCRMRFMTRVIQLTIEVRIHLRFQCDRAGSITLLPMDVISIRNIADREATDLMAAASRFASHYNDEIGGIRLGDPIGVNFGRRMRELYRHRIARFPSLLARIPQIGNACGVVPQCVVR